MIESGICKSLAGSVASNRFRHGKMIL